MSDKSDARTITTDLAWLKNDDPEIYHMLRALDGDLDALRWLRHRGDGLFVFVEALTGAKEALDTLESKAPAKLADLFDTIAHCDVEAWLSENHPELHQLFAFIRGDESALRGLKHKKAAYKRVGDILRAKYRDYHDEDPDGEAAPGGKGNVPVPEGAAADVGCLIGEIHLQNNDFHKAVEAFSRAIENGPTPDAYEGRARAYHALAVLDEQSAGQLRARPAPASGR